MIGVCPACGRVRALEFRRALRELRLRDVCRDCAAAIDAATNRLAARYPAPNAAPTGGKARGR